MRRGPQLPSFLLRSDVAIIGWNAAFSTTAAHAAFGVPPLRRTPRRCLRFSRPSSGRLAEHADNAIKFLSDMYAARLYKLAAGKVGVPDYKDLVTQKLRTAEELYDCMVEQFN